LEFVRNVKSLELTASDMSDLLSVEHLSTLAVVAIASACMVVLARRRDGVWVKAFALVLIADEASWWIFVLLGGVPGAELAQSLPLQLCDVGILIAAAALWTRRPLLVELTYFWGLTGTIQALLSPDLAYGFLTYPYLQYYIAHGGVVAAALTLVVGLGYRPRPNAVLRITGLTLAYAAFVGLVDAATGADYMYLRSKPAAPTLLDVMGPWPWYIASAAALGVLLLLALDAPFRFRSGKQAGPERAKS
jgi:hypothetical integral membrane protein (TIGR02206 family)